MSHFFTMAAGQPLSFPLVTLQPDVVMVLELPDEWQREARRFMQCVVPHVAGLKIVRNSFGDASIIKLQALAIEQYNDD
jgi:hypothetical protein